MLISFINEIFQIVLDNVLSNFKFFFKLLNKKLCNKFKNYYFFIIMSLHQKIASKRI